jgi:hypothetical protein
MRFTKPISDRQIDILPEHFVWWDQITPDDVERLKRAIDAASDEHQLQEFLENNPIFMIQHFSGGHGRWVIPQKRLGCDYVPDFVIGHRHSFGFEWQAVELESPKAKLFNRNGNYSSSLTHAIRQIMDWREWLTKNIDYASRSKDNNGLSLSDITGNVPGLIIIGRRAEIDSSIDGKRKQIKASMNIEIHTYDYLIDFSQGRVNALTHTIP